MVAVVLGPVRFQMPPAAFSGGTGDPPLTARRLVRSTHTIAHGSGGTSRLVLPVSRCERNAARPRRRRGTVSDRADSFVPCNRSCHRIVASRSTGLDSSSHVEFVRDCASTQFARVEIVHVDGSSGAISLPRQRMRFLPLATALHGWRQNAGDVVESEQADSQLSEHYAGLYWQMHNAGGGSGRAKALRGRRPCSGYRAARHHY